jgi:hypothetical protein
MTKDEFFDLCDEKFEDWICADQEGEIVIYTGMKFKGDEVKRKYNIGSKIYGGRGNNINTFSSTTRVTPPKLKKNIEKIK